MTTKIITDAEARELKISSLPSRPTAPAAFGGRGYTATEMKAAFDKLPELIISRLNALITDIESTGDNSLAGAVKTGISDGHTLSRLFSDIQDGDFAGYLRVGDSSLDSEISSICESLAALGDRIGALEERLSDASGNGGGA